MMHFQTDEMTNDGSNSDRLITDRLQPENFTCPVGLKWRAYRQMNFIVIAK